MSILDKVYETGRKCGAGFKESMKITFDTGSEHHEKPLMGRRKLVNGAPFW